MYSHIGVLTRHLDGGMKNETHKFLKASRKKQNNISNIRQMVNGVAKAVSKENMNEVNAAPWKPNDKFKGKTFSLGAKKNSRVKKSKFKGIVEMSAANGRVFFKVLLISSF